MPDSKTIADITNHIAKRDMELTWGRDPQTKIMYIYDYFHDSEPHINVGLNPAADTLKTRVEAKFVITQYQTLAKDQVEFHLRFKPSHTCPLDYFEDTYKKPYNVEYPIGLYIDIPDEKGVYRRWLICGRDYDLQNVSYMILPCDYYYHWVCKGKKYRMWGSSRSQNSYNSGLWTDYKTTVEENQNVMWLPTNEISNTIFYTSEGVNQRIIVSGRRPMPITWKISKVEVTNPLGINRFTLLQTAFNQHTDYIVPLEEADSVYEMYADYFAEPIEPVDPTPEVHTTDYSKIGFATNKLQIGGNSKILNVTFYQEDGSISTTHTMNTDMWTFALDGVDITGSDKYLDIVQLSTDYSKIKIKFYDNSNCPSQYKTTEDYDKYIGKILTIGVSDDNGDCVSTAELILT